MNLDDQEHIEIEPFDREYAIEELLPAGLISALSAQASHLLPEQWAVCTDTGRIYFQQGPWDAGQTRNLEAVISRCQPQDPLPPVCDTDHSIQVFPLIYELETKGYLALCARERDRGLTDRLGSAGVGLLQQVMRLKHQTMLTSSLHGTVVEDSYARLRQKAEQLARSEEKYRHLAANLEIEVQKKTEEIRKAHAHLMQQEKMAAIGQLSAGMAHEINNPLGFMISNLTTLDNYITDLTALLKSYRELAGLCGQNMNACAPPIQSHCQTVEELEQDLDGEFLLADMPQLIAESVSGAERIQKIVRDLKTVARPGENQLELINLHESIDAVLTIVQNRIGPDIVVSRSYGPIPLVPGYPQQINQVWLNLLLNALDAMDHSGKLCITTQTVKDQVRVTISDTGSGIAAQDLPKIFDAFFTTKDVGHGMGLGLHLVYDLVTSHDGRIEVRSEPSKGSTFIVSLPAARGQ